MKMKTKNRKSNYRNVKCNICGKDDYEIYIESEPLENQDNSKKFSTTSNFVGKERIVKCKNCGLIYVNPQIDREEIIEGYSSADESTYVNEKDSRIETFKKCLEEIEKYQKTPGTLLDVGCAAGLFLEVASKKGWKVDGVEPNRWLADWGNKNLGLNIKSAPFEECGFKDGSYDVVTFWDVLEHLADPKKSLIESARILRRGGYLVINYPDIGSWLARLFGKKWWFILSVHLYYFTPVTIRRILEESGYEVVKIQPHIQKLSFGYLVYRLKAYSLTLYKVMDPVVKFLKLDKWQIPYYAGQTMVVAKKI